MSLGPTAHSHVLVERRKAHGSRPDRALLAFARCRNEILRLPAYLAHYRRLGVDRFFIVDNDSSDGSADYLAAQPDVHVFHTASRFSTGGLGMDWLNALLAEFGTGAWCVTADIDELLVYPGCEDVSLRVLTGYFEQHGYEALPCLLLDLYPPCPLEQSDYRPADDLAAAAPFFDPAPYERLPVDLCPGTVIRGGVRARVFYPTHRGRSGVARRYDALLDRLAARAPSLRELPALRARRARNPPCLTKVPLVRWTTGSRYLSIHWIADQRVAPESGVLLHFKFLQDFHARAVAEAARGEYYDGASEYRRYVERLRENPQLCLRDDASVRFEGSRQLVDLELMQDSEPWSATRAATAATRA